MTPGAATALGLVLTVVGLVQVLAPRAWWSTFAPLSFRTPSRVRPSDRYHRHTRLAGIIVTTMGVALTTFVAPWWEQWVAVRVAASVCGVGATAIVAMAVVMVWRGSREPQALPPDEPGEARYASWAAGAGAMVLVFAGACVKGWSIPTPAEERAAWVAENYERWAPTVSAVQPTVGEIPDGDDYVMFAGDYVEVDAAARTPEALWLAAEETGDDAVERLRRADLAIEPQFRGSCPVSDVVVREPRGAYQALELGVVVPRDALAGPEALEPCGETSGTEQSWMLVELDRPLGEGRVVLPVESDVSRDYWVRDHITFEQPPW